MTLIEILNGTNKDILANIELLSKEYFKKTGRKVCKTCPSDIQNMILTLKNIYKMCQFKFKRPAAMYKDKKGDTTTISNGNMTDEKAIEFLKTDPQRIKLFSDYPSNWAKLITEGAKPESSKEKEKRIAIEAELKTSKNSKKGQVLDGKSAKKDLYKMSLKDLRKEYPTVKATSIKKFIAEVLKTEGNSKPAGKNLEEKETEAQLKTEDELQEAAIAEAKKAAEEAAAE